MVDGVVVFNIQHIAAIVRDWGCIRPVAANPAYILF